MRRKELEPQSNRAQIYCIQYTPLMTYGILSWAGISVILDKAS